MLLADAKIQSFPFPINWVAHLLLLLLLPFVAGMAGQAVLSAFVPVILEKLAAAALEELRLLQGVDGELKKLSSTLLAIQAVVEDAEEKQVKDKAVRDWLRKLKDAAYDADDLLDMCAAEALRWKVEGRSQGGCLMSCHCYSEILFRRNVSHRIKRIRASLDDVARERDALHLRESGGMCQVEIPERPQTSSLIDDFYVFGRELDKENIVTLLLSDDESSRANVPIVAIIGMGGLGKTTLAQLVYNDVSLESYFQLRMWVCVSENFDVTKLTREILESAGGGNMEGNTSFATNMNLLQEGLRQKLSGKRFLLVLDDVWNEDQEKWHRLRAPLIQGGKGSKVIVTTRNENVTRIMSASASYILKGLLDDDCWLLFKRWAFVDGSSDGHPKLEEIGKNIVKKLKGLPLAAKALGSLLYSKLDENDWKNVLTNEVWELPPDSNNILPALRLSYQHLPPHLKQCFAYCAIFHKGCVFEKDTLIQIWMALGFIQPQRGKRLEDVGNTYFDDLLSRSLFQYDGNYYVMHDMIHDLAQSISLDECFRIEAEEKLNIPGMARHVSVSSYKLKPTIFEDFYKFENLRTLLLLRGYTSRIQQVPQGLFLKLRYLRVLDLCRRNITELPTSIGNLKQLRYLSLSGTGIRMLPLSISSLYNLQTLKLKGCFSLSELPRGITSLINLRHLEANARIISKIHGIGKLTSLQELEEFPVRREIGYNVTELKYMMELHRKLCIQNLENIICREEATGAMLHEKKYLSILELKWTEDRDTNLHTDFVDDEILEGLEPHSNVKELRIEFYGGLSFPSWMGSISLSNLQIICLSHCKRCKFLPPLGQLPFLRYLEIEGMYALKQIGHEFFGKGDVRGFPSLQELLLQDMPVLEEWCALNEGPLFPRLHELYIEDCPKMEELPQLPPRLARLRISGVGLSCLPKFYGYNDTAEKQSFLQALSPSLSSLYISDCPKLTTLHGSLLDHQLSSLGELSIRDCEELVSMPAEGFKPFSSLNSLHIYNCPKLALSTKDTGLPTSLKNIQLYSCSDIATALFAGIKNFTSLQHLQIANCPNLVYFPEEGLPMTLEFFGIFDCTDLRCLPTHLQELSSLKTMIVSNCPQIPSLPDEALPCMLSELYIRGCPMLEDRCRKEEGEDWPKIAHILNIEINGEEIVSETKGRRTQVIRRRRRMLGNLSLGI